MSAPALLICDLGTMPYGEAHALQRAVAYARISGAFGEDLLLLVEHPPVITTGRSTKPGNLLATPELLAARGVELYDVERGGDVTFHGPGQLVGYPIIDLKRHKQDLHWYLRRVEEALMFALGSMGITAGRSPGQTGVWVEGRKIASIGVHARDWVTWHGFALNVTTDLSFFDLMVPCGIAQVEMTSVVSELTRASQEIARGQTLESTARDLTGVAFAEVFQLTRESLEVADLQRVLAADAGGQ